MREYAQSFGEYHIFQSDKQQRTTAQSMMAMKYTVKAAKQRFAMLSAVY
jgi:hypothetical protein